MARIAAAFAATKAAGRAAFIGYLPAGFPTRAGFLAAARTILDHADVLEVGLPFSDPLGDGPTIQRAGEAALAGGMSAKGTLETVAELRSFTQKPLLVMTYYNPIYCYPGGEAGFMRELKEAGGDGVILPDLPPDEAESLIVAARAAEVDTVFLVAPTSTAKRLELVTAACRGFVYAVSVTGVTGARDRLGADVAELVRRCHELTDLPVAVGFGVASRATAKAVAEFADGVVVGSALVEAAQRGTDLEELCRELAAGCVRA